MMKSQWMLILAFIFALIIAVFAVINVDPVEVNFVFGKTQTPLILVILFSTLFGGLTVGSLGIVRVFVLQRKVKQYEKQLEGINGRTMDSEAPEDTRSSDSSYFTTTEEKQPTDKPLA